MNMTGTSAYLQPERSPHSPLLLGGRRISCILFDLGGTLWTARDAEAAMVHERAAGERAAAVLRQAAGATISDEAQADESADAVSLGDRIRRAWSLEIHRRDLESQDTEPDFVDVTQQALLSLNVIPSRVVDRDLAARVYEALRVSSAASRILFDDVLEMLSTLRSLGLRLGIVTNRRWGGAPFREDLRRLGLLDYFAPEHIAVSADLGIKKPNPAIFHTVLRVLDVPPEAAAMVGNSLFADVAGAQQANILAVLKPSTHERAAAHARWLARTTPVSVSAASPPVTPEPLASHEPLPEQYPSEDAYLLDYIHWYERRLVEWRRPADHRLVRPDLTITNIGDLVPLLRAG